jgi:hypothetical protein
VVEPKRIIGKNGGPRRRKGTRGRWPPKKQKKTLNQLQRQLLMTFLNQIMSYNIIVVKIYK